jgi:hypothetical protein
MIPIVRNETRDIHNGDGLQTQQDHRHPARQERKVIHHLPSVTL